MDEWFKCQVHPSMLFIQGSDHRSRWSRLVHTPLSLAMYLNLILYVGSWVVPGDEVYNLSWVLGRVSLTNLALVQSQCLYRSVFKRGISFLFSIFQLRCDDKYKRWLDNVQRQDGFIVLLCGYFFMDEWCAVFINCTWAVRELVGVNAGGCSGPCAWVKTTKTI